MDLAAALAAFGMWYYRAHVHEKYLAATAALKHLLVVPESLELPPSFTITVLLLLAAVFVWRLRNVRVCVRVRACCCARF